jgi:hypothetical protein
LTQLPDASNTPSFRRMLGPGPTPVRVPTPATPTPATNPNTAAGAWESR